MHEMVSEGINTTIIGMGVVFSVLIILSFTTWLLNALVAKFESKGKQKREQKAEASETAAAPKEAVVSGISGATVAAITAALVIATGRPAGSFRYTSIRRSGGWRESGLQELVRTQQRYTEGGK